MQFRVLGPVELAADGRRIVLRSDRQRAVLAALLAHPGETLPVGRLIDAVWDGDPPTTATASLYSHVSRLRQLLASVAVDGADTLATESGGYRAELSGHELDAARFEALLTRSREVRDTDPGGAVKLLDEALALWRGPAYGDLAERGIDVVRAAAARLEELRVMASADRADAVLALGGHAGLVAELEAAVALQPLAERPHRQLMFALYRSGRQADALAVYRALHRRMRKELGLDPSPDLQRLHELMLRHDADLGPVTTAYISAVAADARPADAELRRSIAGRDGDVVGRDDDLASLAQMVDPGTLVTLTGPGGVGKTRLATELTTRIGERFPDGVGLCSLAAVDDAGAVPAAVVSALDIPHKGSRSADETLLAALGTRRMLFVLDNCEHLLQPVSALVEVVRRRCPQVAILITSREYLRLPGEQVWDVVPLSVPPANASVAEVAASPSGALFNARARAANPRFALTSANAAAVAEICRRLDGLPLAIELAAARIRAFTPADLAARLDDRFRLLTAGHPGRAGRHRTLQAAVDWSYGQLTGGEKRLFDRLSVFAGSLTLTAAEQVCADDELPRSDIAGLLAELVDKSMVGTTYSADGSMRYHLLDTMRAYGRQRLDRSGAADEVRRAQAKYYVDLVHGLAPAVRGADERAAVAAIDAEIDNLRLAHGWLVGAGDVSTALRLACALHDYTHYRLRDEIVTWTRRALVLPGATTDPSFSGALATAARGALHRGELDRARGNATTALAHAEPDSLPVLWALHVLTEVALYQGRLDEALDLAGRRADLAERLGRHYYRALAGVSLMLALLYAGSATEALGHAGEAEWAAAECGNATARAWVRYAHGEVLLDTDPQRAAELLEQAIDTATRINSKLVRGVALVSLASLLGRSGDTRRAIDLFRAALRHWRRIGDHTHQVTTLRNLVELFARLRVDEPAATVHGAAAGGPAPAFGAGAERLDAAWEQLEARLGTGRAHAAADRGRRLPLPQLVDETLAQLDALAA